MPRHIGGKELRLRAFLTSKLDGDELHAPAALPSEKESSEPTG